MKLRSAEEIPEAVSVGKPVGVQSVRERLLLAPAGRVLIRSGVAAVVCHTDCREQSTSVEEVCSVLIAWISVAGGWMVDVDVGCSNKVSGN